MALAFFTIERGLRRGLCALVVSLLLGVVGCSPDPGLRVVVQDRIGPVAGATVRVDEHILQADGKGHAAIPLADGDPVRVWAWSDAHYIAHGGKHVPGDGPVIIELVRLDDVDDEKYTWVNAYVASGQAEACQPCHSDHQTPDLPFDGWVRSRHATAATNPIFRSTYAGTDAQGRQEQPTRFVNTRYYGRQPVPAILNETHSGPGFKLDWPDHAGNCAACHAPAAAVNAPYGVDMGQLSATDREGVGCDFCHKIWDVVTDPKTGRPYPYRPGVLSFALRRPPEGHQFFSSGHRIARRGGTFRQVQKQSAICAPCHHAVFNGTVIYNSFGEWLDSAYSDPVAGKTCQDCHMPSRGGRFLAAPGSGGQAHAPEQVPTHTLPGSYDAGLTRTSVGIDMACATEDGVLSVSVSVVNESVGHHIPTGSPWRQLFLVVLARDIDGRALDLIEGPVLPKWMGSGGMGAGGYAGLPGQVFEKRLYSQWYGFSPAFDYWNPCLVEADTRIPANGRSHGRFRFAASVKGGAVVEAVVIYRPINRQLAQRKGWRVEDAIRARKRIAL